MVKGDENRGPDIGGGHRRPAIGDPAAGYRDTTDATFRRPRCLHLNPMSPRLFIAPLLLCLAGCGLHGQDLGPIETSSDRVAPGAAESVQVRVGMNAGELKVAGGGATLLDSTFRYTQDLGRPTVRYEVKDRIGRLTVDSPKSSLSIGHRVNDWGLQFGDKTPLELDVHLGAGESTLDLKHLPIRRVDVHMGAGELTLKLGSYNRDVDVNVTGGVGEANIYLPRGQGVIARASGGLGSIEAKDLDRRDGYYYNAAHAPGQPAIKLNVRGGVGEIRMIVED